MQKQFGSALFGRASVNIFISPALLSFLLPQRSARCLAVCSHLCRFDLIYCSILFREKGAGKGMAVGVGVGG